MKHFYSIITALTCTFSAWCASGELIQPTIARLDGKTAMKAAARSNEAWTPVGNATITDDLIASVYKDIAISSFEAPIEQSTTTPGLYRITNPYKNWKPGSDAFTYDSSTDYYLYLHAENPDGVWVEDFSTGWTELGNDGGEITVVSYQALYLSEYDYDTVFAQLPDMFGKLKDGKATFPSTFWNMSQSAPVFLLGIGDTSEGYYTGNKEAGFSIELPSEWESIGKGKYTDDIIASVYGIDVLTKEVDIERKTSDPTLLRVVNPYAAWADEAKAAGLAYDNEKHYMVIHTEHAPYVWIEDFETGFTEERGKVVFASDAAYFTDKYGFEDALDETPGIYGQLDDNVISYAAEYSDGWDDYPCLFVEVGENATTVFANNQGKFRLELPAGETPSDPDWTVLGEGTYTDDLLSAIYPEAGNQTYAVVIEQNKEDEGLFRIANPYASWVKPEGAAASYDSSKNYYLTFHIATDPADAAKKYVWLDDFATGVSTADYEVWITSEAGNMAGMLGIEDTYAYYPELFGTFADLAVTFPATWQESGKDYPVLMIMEGEDSWDTIDANTAGKFRITFPGFSGITDTVITDTEAPVEYYNLQGIRVDNPTNGLYIRRQGKHASKVLMK